MFRYYTNNLRCRFEHNRIINLLSLLGTYLEIYKDWGHMQAYVNNYPTDMVSPGGVGIFGSGDHAIVGMEDTNNIGVMRLAKSKLASGLKASDVTSGKADKLSFSADQSFFFEAASRKSVNAVGFGESRENGPYEFLRIGELFATPGDDYALMGMSGGIRGRATQENKFGTVHLPSLLIESSDVRNASITGGLQGNATNPFMGKAISPGFELIEGGHAVPRQVATLHEVDTDGDGVSNHIESFNRWNSYRGITGDRIGSVVSMSDGGVISDPTLFQEMNCEQQYFLPESGLGYRFNHFYQPEFSMNLGTWSCVSAVERIGEAWHKQYLSGEIDRPYFQVSFMGSPKGMHLTNTVGTRMIGQIRSGKEVCFPYLKVGSDQAHDFVISNGGGDLLNNHRQWPSGFDKQNNAKLVEMLVEDPSVIYVTMDPLALQEMSDVIASLQRHPKIKVQGLLDKDVESRRSLDSFMLVEFVCATPIDLDVDSDNNGGSQSVEGSSKEEALENPIEHGSSFASKHFGKILQVNTGDIDEDGIPDYADATSSANANQGVETKNLTAVLVKFPPANTLPLEVTELIVRFTYDSSDPSFPTSANDYALPAQGTMRLWLGDGGQPPRPKFIRNVNKVGSGGDWVKDGVWYSKADLGVSGDAVTLFIESVKASNSPADQQLKVELTYRQANGNYVGLGSDTVAFTSNGISLVPDYNRDGKIDIEDKGKWYAGDTFYFWTNTDDDEGETKGDDIPDKSIETPSLFSRVNPFSSPTGDAMTKSNGLGNISGVRDLIDYFPVHIDLGTMLNSLDLDEVDLVLRGPDINFALPDAETGAIDPLTCGDYLRVVDTAKKFAELEKTRTSGNKLLTYSNDPSKDRAFLEQVKLGKGVILLEGRVETDEPLVLEVYYKGNVIASTEMNLQILEVEDMYRWVNLRHITGGEEERTTSLTVIKYPDSLSNGKQLIFVHGFNVPEKSARGWSAEIFKRMWWSGSNAMFTGVTWNGNETPGTLPAGAYYHADVINAFQTASELKNAIDSLPGTEKFVAAHSLGNMLVSSAIVDHGLDVELYFMINAAVAMQAYKSDEEQIAEISQPRVWLDYYQSKKELVASDWFRLFPSTDGRYDLRWKGRFGDISNAVNYYSTGDEVLANNDTEENMYTPKAEKAWVFQEKIKGGTLPRILSGVHSHGGWGFNSHWNVGLFERMPPVDAINIDNQDLIMEPFHDPFYYNEIHGPNGSGFASDPDVRAKVLAEAIPATSRAAGSNMIDRRFLENTNLMDLKFEWPDSRGKDLNWKHSDSREVAYLYTYKFFDDIVEDKGKGSLK